MFQFSWLSYLSYFIQISMTGHNSSLVSLFGDLRIKAVSSSPKLIAANHDLHRQPVPRYPPCALIILTYSLDSQFRFEKTLGISV